MRLSAAVKFIILTHASCYVPSVLCKKGIMGDGNDNDNNNDERMLASSSSKDYSYRRNYIAIIEPENFVALSPNAGGIVDTTLDTFFDDRPLQIQGSSTILNGKIYDPADIEIVNRFNGVEPNDIPFEVFEFFEEDTQCFFGQPFAGGRQPKQPIPPGDSAFFYHGYCTATSGFDNLDEVDFRRRTQSNQLVGAVSSHSCKLNICLGNGGFNCIAFYSGTSFVFDVAQQISIFPIVGGELSLPPPFPATIIGGTGSFEGIEGTVDIATICGTTGPVIDVSEILCRKRDLSQEEQEVRHLQTFPSIKLGLIVQTISINANMPLPTAP